jgi:hypothetical protein
MPMTRMELAVSVRVIFYISSLEFLKCPVPPMQISKSL